MDIEEALDILNNIIADEVIGTYCIEIQKEVDCSKNCKDEDCYLIQAIETVLSELEKKEKQIDLMAKEIYECNEYIDNEFERELKFKSVEDVKQYFTKKVEGK